jgi:hypothetical protein
MAQGPGRGEPARREQGPLPRREGRDSGEVIGFERVAETEQKSDSTQRKDAGAHIAHKLSSLQPFVTLRLSNRVQ